MMGGPADTSSPKPDHPPPAGVFGGGGGDSATATKGEPTGKNHLVQEDSSEDSEEEEVLPQMPQSAAGSSSSSEQQQQTPTMIIAQGESTIFPGKGKGLLKKPLMTVPPPRDHGLRIKDPAARGITIIAPKPPALPSSSSPTYKQELVGGGNVFMAGSFYDESLGKQSGFICAAPTVFHVREWPHVDSIDPIPKCSYGVLARGKKRGNADGVCFPFGGWEWDEEDIGKILERLNASAASAGGSMTWNEDHARNMIYVPFPCSKPNTYYVYDYNHCSDRHEVVVPSPPDFIPLVSSFDSKENAVKVVYSHLKDLSEIRSIRSIRAGDSLYMVQKKIEGSFPPGLYRIDIVTRFSPSWESMNSRSKDDMVRAGDDGDNSDKKNKKPKKEKV